MVIKDIEAPAGSSKQFSVADAGPADGLHRRDMMPLQFGDEIPGKVLVNPDDSPRDIASIALASEGIDTAIVPS